MKVFHCNYSAQTLALIKALDIILLASNEPKPHHNYVIVDVDKILYRTAVSIERGTEFTHLTLDDTDALKLLNPEAVLPFLLGFKPTHARD